MNVLKYRVSLDMFNVSSQTTIKAKKGDSACQIHITLTESGRIYEIGEGCYATFNAKKADGNFIYDNCTIENDTIVYDFSSSIDENGNCQVTACEGIVDCEVTLYNADAEQLTSPRFTLIVDDTVYNGEEIASTTYVNGLKELIDEANEIVEEIETKLENGELGGGVPVFVPGIDMVDGSWAFTITSDKLKGEVGELFVMIPQGTPPATGVVINGKTIPFTGSFPIDSGVPNLVLITLDSMSYKTSLKAIG